ncbi:exportin-5 [Pseudophryne corroboree]|uniref:exportin-5 n=1 Tax=Pseudophryne corroboree TaxID=495146 RepID=UPI00308199FC
MAEQVKTLCEQLVQAVTVIMEPGSSQELRLEALKFCETFKEECTVCVPCGLQLAEKSQPPVIRHFGLQVLEHVVKFQWNDMQGMEKVCLKERVMGLIANGIHPILQEEGHIKDVLARIVVEMIKREWPQQWPDMLNELEFLTKNGAVQTELVMFILLRLAEDVVTFRNLPTMRRKDIQTTMTKDMDKLFTFMLNILGESVLQYQQLKSDLAQKDKCQEMCRVALAALNTLAGYIDWVHISHITAQDCKLLQMLCALLSEEELQVEAVEALLIAVSRKGGKIEHQTPLLILFGDNPMHCIMTAAQKAHGEGLQEKRYVFLKRLCQVLCAIINQLCSLTLSPEVKVEIPVTFGKYLNVLLNFTVHPSQFLRSSTVQTWGSLFKNEVLSKDPALKAIVPGFMRVSMNNIAKVGFPSRNDSSSCEYSRLDFDSDEDFNNFFNSYKATLRGVIREACRIDPHTSFRMADEWLQFQLCAPLDLGLQNSTIGEGLCRFLSPSHIQWEAMTAFCESVIGSILRILPKEELPVSRGIELLESVLSYETKDPIILSCILNHLSTFFPFVHYMNGFMPTVLNKLFSAATLELDNKGPRTRAVKTLRQHACFSLIKICRDSAEMVMPHLDLLCTRALLLLHSQHLAIMEKCALMEAQVLLSNHFKDFEKQRVFLEQLLSPAVSTLLSEEVQRAVSSPDELISYIGREVLRGTQEEDDLCQMRRSQLSFSLHVIDAVVRRVRCPSDPTEAKSGGFVVGYTPAGTPICRNPCSELVLKFMDTLLSLVRTQNNLFLPDIMQTMGDHYAKCLDMLDGSKKSILGMIQPLLDTYDIPVYKSTQERLQAFFCSMSDNCYHILGNLGPSFLLDFYSIPDLETLLFNSIFCNLNNVPDFRLKALLRSFVKPFVLSCPPEKYEMLLCPILGPLLNFLHQRLSQKWSGDDYTELSTETTEILEIELVRLLTRELVDLIIVCCIEKKKVDHSTSNAGVDGMNSAAQNDEDEEMMVLDATSVGSLELSELGKFLMSNEVVSTALLVSAYSSLTWKDTPTCRKVVFHLCWPLLKQVISRPLRAEAVVGFYSYVLGGLQTHGQNEDCNSHLNNLAFQIYEALRPRYPELRTMMEQVPEIKSGSLEMFDSQLLTTVDKQPQKRKMFKRLLSGCVGKPLGEQFRKEVHIRNLPSLFQKKTKPKPDSDPILGSCDEALTSLFQP